MAFQNLFIVNFENENFKKQSAFANTATQSHSRIYVFHSYPRLIIIGNGWQKLLCYAAQAKKGSTKTCYEIALLRNCFIVPLARFSCPLHNIPKDIHQWIGCQANTFVFIKDTNYCNKLKY